ncbi:MAG: putative Transcriptional regulator ModE [Nitrospira sp.]
MGVRHQAESVDHFRNELKNLRAARGLSQGELASKAGITRQAVSSIESNLYLPTTAVALRLAEVLSCRVEDLFSLAKPIQPIQGVLVGTVSERNPSSPPVRVKVAMVGSRIVVRPVTGLGDVLSCTVGADGYLAGAVSSVGGATVEVMLSRDRQAIEQEISVAGCDPAIFLAGEHMRRRKDQTSVVGWTMGSMAALRSLQRGEVHVAGLHLFDPATGESNLPFVRRALKGSGYDVVTFATWEEGFLVRKGNPKSIRAAADLADATVTFLNREEGSGARLLLDRQLRESGVAPAQVRGYDRMVLSHFEVARAVAGHQADVGIGIRSAAQYFDLDFVPLQSARYDLVVPKTYLKSHPTLANLFETIVSRPFRNEIESLGGYDTSETGKMHVLRS